MVGVPGKYKGCNTCRARRVKCDNQRPECRKCTNSSRPCQGYKREQIFIVSTRANRGRCSSHPHRSLSKPRRQKQPCAPAPSTDHSSLVEIEDENGVLQDLVPGAPSGRIQCLALQTSRLPLNPVYNQDGESFVLSSLKYHVPDAARQSHAPEFSLRALCLLQHCPKGKGRASTAGHDTAARAKDLAQSVLFVYEVCPSSDSPRDPTTPDVQVAQACAWRSVLGGNARLMKQRGPSRYKSFPSHHFFTRLYRKEACFDAMTRRKGTFLADPEWCTVPWERIPKNEMDLLFDIQVLLPGIFERGERLENYQPSIPRRLKAKDLLQNCFQIDKSFHAWYGELESKSLGRLFWQASAQFGETMTPEEWAGTDMGVMPPTRLEFVDLKMAFLHIYYWAALCYFYRSIQHIHTLFAEEIAASPSTPLPFHSPAPQTQSLAPPHQPLAQSRPGPQFVPAPPPNQLEFQPVLLPFDLMTTHPPQLFGPQSSGQAFHPQQQYDNPYAVATHQSPYAVPSPIFPDFAISTDSPFSSPFSFAAQSSFTPSPVAPSPPPPPPQPLRNAPSPSYVSPPYPRSRTSTPTLIANPPFNRRPSALGGHRPTSSSQRQAPVPSPPVPSLDSKYGEAAIFELANLISHSLPYILERTSSTASPAAAASQIATARSPFSSGRSPSGADVSCLDSYGPDHTLWPLSIARQVYRRQNRVEQLAWCGQQMETVRRQGSLIAQRASRDYWQDWSEENVEG